MKKICYSLIIMLTALCHACTPETELLFDKPASERMSEALEKYRQLLVSASDGWLVEYYPHSSRTYGGFSLFLQFTEKGEVAVRSDADPRLLAVDEATSLYSLDEDMGPTLNFDTHNEVLDFFSDPAQDVGGGAGLGLEGDYEFVFISGDASGIILRGKKTKNTIRMTPMTAEGWLAYRDGVQAMREKIFAPAYSMTVNGKAVTITRPLPAYNRFKITYKEEGKGEPLNASMPYIITPTGIRFYEALTIDGVTIRELTFDNTSGQLKSADGKAVTGKVFPSIDDFFINTLTSTQWTLSDKTMGSKFQKGFKKMDAAISAIEENMVLIWIGRSVVNKLPSVSFVTSQKNNYYYGSNLLNIKLIDKGASRIKIEVTTQYEGDGGWYAQNVPAVKDFFQLLRGEYIVTFPDPLDNVKTIILTDPVDLSRSLVLKK